MHSFFLYRNYKAQEFLVNTENLPNVTYYGMLVNYAGLLPVSGSSDPKDKLFFWYFEAEEWSNNLIFWFAGGPGCATTFNVFTEHGPFARYNYKTKKFVNNPHSWHHDAHVVYIDQPFGVGFSRYPGQTRVENENQVGDYFYKFLINFFKVFPQLQAKGIYLGGESYTGFYVPYIAKSILDHSENSPSFDLEGILINDPLIDHYWRQIPSSSLAYFTEQNLLNSTTQVKLQQQYNKCLSFYQSKKSSEATGTDYFNSWASPGECDIQNIGYSSIRETTNPCFLEFDIRDNCQTHPPPQQLFNLQPINYTEYFRDPRVRAALHVPEEVSPWEICVSDVLVTDPSLVAVNILPYINERGVKILIWTGDKDALINHIGVEWSIGNLTWAGATGFLKNNIQPICNAKNQVVGKLRTERNLTYILINNAGHFLTADQQEVSRLVLRNVVFGDPAITR
ncbi:10399_t:CDS:10 [Ambispora gerdemannii]|uniref:Pheromone-processing carboxypeptidase KEX1 n=1 Tax=Ambispora gerdemannii TaxID=144530 RepID=A0A9N8YTT9_9GLOM|nr:10399_t:CDS:10 [Ambispora gerdemannii]